MSHIKVLNFLVLLFSVLFFSLLYIFKAVAVSNIFWYFCFFLLSLFILNINAFVNLLKGKTDLFSPYFFIIVLILYYIIGIVNPFGLQIHSHFSPDVIATLRLIVLIFFGILCFLLGMHFGKRIGESTVIKWCNHKISDLTEQKLFRICLIYSFIGYIFSIPVYLKLGIPLASFADPGAARHQFYGAISPYTMTQWLVLDIISVLSIFGFLKFREKRFLIITILNLLIVSGLSSRVALGFPIMMILIIYQILRGRPIRFVNVIFWGVIGVIIIGGLWLFRIRSSIYSGVSYELYGITPAVFQSPLEFLKGSITGVFIFCRTSVETFLYFLSCSAPIMYGEITLMSILAIQPGQQQEIGLYKVTQIVGYDPYKQGGTTVSLLGGLYLDFRIVGIIFGMFILGFILNFLYANFKKHNSLFALLSYSIVLTYYLTMIYGGQFLDTGLVWRIFLVFLVLQTIKKTHEPMFYFSVLIYIIFLAIGFLKELEILSG